jgi:citryl-CoA synthetase large subunit
MKLYEYEAYDKIFRKYGIPLPKYINVTAPGADVEEFYNKVGDVVVKSQVLVGKRGKAGAIKVAKSADEANAHVEALMKMDVYGEQPVSQLIVQKLNIVKELYCSITWSTKDRAPALTFSYDGGMEVEEVDASKIKTIAIDPLVGLSAYQVRDMLVSMGNQYPSQLRQISEAVAAIYRAFWESESRLLEINPLVIVKDKEGKERVYAADAVVQIDDDASVSPAKTYGARSAMGRPMTEREHAAGLIDRDDHRGKAGSYVELDGDIAMMTFGGGGSTVTTGTCYEIGLKPANLTDIGGNPPAEKMNKIAKVILSKPNLKAILICGGTASNTRIDVTLGEGLVSALDEMAAEGTLPTNIPWLVRRSGPEFEKGLKMLYEGLKKHGIKAEVYDSELPLTAAPARLKEILEGKI